MSFLTCRFGSCELRPTLKHCWLLSAFGKQKTKAKFMEDFEGTGESRNSSNALLSAVAKRHVVEYWTAVLDDGEEISIRKEDALKLELKDGQSIKGLVEEDYVQNRYEDGSYARSYSVDKWFEVDGNCT